MDSTIRGIVAKLTEALVHDPPESITKAIASVNDITETSDLGGAAKYIANTLYSFGLSDDEIKEWDAQHLAEIGGYNSEVDKEDKNVLLKFYRGWFVRIERVGGPHLNLTGRPLSPEVAIADLGRVERIADYLRSLANDFAELRRLLRSAEGNARVFANTIAAKVNTREFENALDEHLSENHASGLKVLVLRIPKILAALSRNYYYVPDRWLDCLLSIQFSADTRSRDVAVELARKDEFVDIQKEIEKEVWRIENQPGYLATETKLSLLQHTDSLEAEPADGAPPVDDLTPKERNIMEALGSKTMPAKQLAKVAGYTCNSHFRETLSNLVKRNHLTKSPDGVGYLRK